MFDGMVVLHLGVHTVWRTMVFLKSIMRELLISQVLLLLQISELPCKTEELLPPALPLHCADYLWDHKLQW